MNLNSNFSHPWFESEGPIQNSMNVLFFDGKFQWIFECDGLFSFLVNFIFHNRHSEFYGIRISRRQLKSLISRDIDVLRLPFFYQSKAESQGFRLVKEWASEDINISRYGRFEFGIIKMCILKGQIYEFDSKL